MELINAYFEGIVFTKVEQKEEYTLYAALLNQGNNKFAIAMVRNHMALLNQCYLKDLSWVCFQTRTLKRRYNLKSQNLPKTKLPNPLFHEIERTQATVKYGCNEYPLELLLLNDPHKKGMYQYPRSYNLIAGFLSFNSVITPITDIVSLGVPPPSVEFIALPD